MNEDDRRWSLAFQKALDKVPIPHAGGVKKPYTLHAHMVLLDVVRRLSIPPAEARQIAAQCSGTPRKQLETARKLLGEA